MARKPKLLEPMTMAEWDSLPVTFGADVAARVLGCNLRYVQNHAKDYGARLIAGRWLFCKPTIAAIVGLES